MCLGDGFAFQIPEKGIAARVLTDVVDGGDKYQEHAENIYAEAQQINEDRAAKEAVIDDESDFVEDTEEAAEAEDAE